MIVGMGGAKGAGKNTAAKILVEKYGFKEISFASALKTMCADAFRLPIQMFEDTAIKDRPFGHPVLLTEDILLRLYFAGKALHPISEEQFRLMEKRGGGCNLKSPRHILQFVGTELFRTCVDDKFWCRALESQLQSDGNIVVPDVRFENERKAIKNKGGWLVLVERVGPKPTDVHASENNLGSKDEYDFLAMNSATIEALHAQIEMFYHTKSAMTRIGL